jgi:hypothetical protein
MNAIDVFKNAASKSLPEAIYQQLLPHLDTLLSSYEDQRSEESQMMDWQVECDEERFRDIRREYEDATEINWQAFARERWPDIDKYFTFEQIDPLTRKVVHPPKKAPTPPPWARIQPAKPE